jgi:hypothetical protein
MKRGGTMLPFRQPAPMAAVALDMTMPVQNAIVRAAPTPVAQVGAVAPAGAAMQPVRASMFGGEDPAVMAAIAKARQQHAPAGWVPNPPARPPAARPPARATPAQLEAQRQSQIQLTNAQNKLAQVNAAQAALDRGNDADLQRFTQGLGLASDALAMIGRGISSAIDADVARARIAADLEIARVNARAAVEVARIAAANAANAVTAPPAVEPEATPPQPYEIVVGVPKTLDVAPPPPTTTTTPPPVTKTGLLEFVKAHPVATTATVIGVGGLIVYGIVTYMNQQKALQAKALADAKKGARS